MYSMNIFGLQLDEEFDLYLESYTIPSPEVQTDYKKIPGMNGSIDRTEKFGTVFFKNRDWDNIVLKSTSWATDEDSKVELERELLNAIHGKSGRIIFDDDAEHYWQGRVFVQDVYVEGNAMLIVDLGLVTEPFKYGINGKTFTLNLSGSEQSVTLTNGRKVIVPKVIVTDNASLAYTVQGVEHTRELTAGTWRLTDLLLYEGSTIVTATGSGTLTIQYEDAQL